MTPRAFFDMVEQMRKAQRDYFKSRSPYDLTHAKTLERLVDKEIERVHKVLTEPKFDF